MLSFLPRAKRRGAAGNARAVILALVLMGASIAAGGLLYLRSAAAPDVVFTSLAGERVGTVALKGRVMVVSFWATDCAICVKEMPDLVRTYTQFRERGLELVAVAMRHDPPNYVIHYAERNQLPFKVALDPLGEHARAFGNVRVTPTTVVIDKAGRIAMRHIGAIDFPKLNALLEEKLAEQPS